jgi:hypothetical protein
MTIIGYARVNTTDQDLEIQIAALKREGSGTIRSGKPPGGAKRRIIARCTPLPGRGLSGPSVGCTLRNSFRCEAAELYAAPYRKQNGFDARLGAHMAAIPRNVIPGELRIEDIIGSQ